MGAACATIAALLVSHIMKNAKNGRTLNAEVYAQLRAQILTGQFMPRQRLKVSQLSEQHGVSLNVVREALNRLAGEQLVELQPQFGFAVRGLSAEDLVDLFEQRGVVESLALRQSIARGDLNWQSDVVAAHHRLGGTAVVSPDDPQKLNPEWLARHEEFNLVMMRACGSPRLLQIVRQLAEASAIYQRALLPLAAVAAELETEHDDLLQRILDGDADGAVRVLLKHMEQTRDAMLPFLVQQEVAEQA
ncbi:hypothetical protein NB2BOR_A16690 [Bordetella parapertussis]|uniref:Regulatory protein n=2 Tax=Bordetella parapertussis TaxID=519 RepID=Q7W6X8_BORPA|nr:hypothetical protein NB2BOR_A16690 [Bordetella parapertussis]CAE38059.1 Putative regulatory protein [Bordetella parapertussis]